jgi:hypothetical protein
LYFDFRLFLSLLRRLSVVLLTLFRVLRLALLSFDSRSFTLSLLRLSLLRLPELFFALLLLGSLQLRLSLDMQLASRLFLL